MPLPLYPLDRDPIPIVKEAGWTSHPVWTGVENLSFTGVETPNHPSCRELLYQLQNSSPAPVILNVEHKRANCHIFLYK